MACSKYQYVKQFQEHRTALPDTFIVIRIDGRSFTKFCQAHKFKKPSDLRAIGLINEAAKATMKKFKQIIIGYGQSDEYSFALAKNCQLFNRRIDKIETCVVSYFTSCYIINFHKYFPSQNPSEQSIFQQLQKEPPSFDCRIVLYPNQKTFRDYFRWRQVDCHINNLYNTVFWCMVQKKKMKNTDVQNLLKDTNSGQKNEILFQQFGINYNNIEEIYRKGTILCYRGKCKEKKITDVKLPTNINKQLKTSMNNLETMNSAISRMEKKLSESQQQSDLITFKQLQGIRQELGEVQKKYEQILNKNKQNTSFNSKQGKIKYELVQIYEDLINEDFWETIKIQ